MDKINCPKCGAEIEIDKALEGQIEARVLIGLNEKHQQELAQVKKEASVSAQAQLKERLSHELEKNRQQAALEYEKLKVQNAQQMQKEAQKQELLVEQLRSDAQAAREANKELREELMKLNKSLQEERRSRENAELAAAQKINEESSRIREEAKKDADELHRLKEQELQKQLADTKKALDDAMRKAEQGSEQLQGEVLELELETLLRNEFPTDLIEEVKKGQRGADIKQYVRSNRLEECGLLLWESKNAKWSREWIAKIKADVRAAGAGIGVIVSRELPDQYNDMCNVEGSIWVVKPRLVAALAAALRATILQVYSANRNAENKDEKMEILYQFLTGVEFKNRIEAIVDNYNTLQQEIEKEKRAAQLRWARQEKAISAVIGNTYGLYGDLQGITGSELQIPMLESGD
ncbi:DUF2130 domain-containing protein [Christensenellaceae bacterium OttesenSCG-928-K19]|nr:DUF2130 domain-containing protein [Christensenellaceae bacterium OttesenSCG-928-K19]